MILLRVVNVTSSNSAAKLSAFGGNAAGVAWNGRRQAYFHIAIPLDHSKWAGQRLDSWMTAMCEALVPQCLVLWRCRHGVANS